MQIKKWIATGLSALMAGATLAGAGLAATQLGAFPGFLASKTATTSALDAFVVVGEKAQPADVIGAVDLAARLAELSYTVTAVKGTVASAVTGLDRDGINIGTDADGAALSEGGSIYNVPFPSGTLTTSHFTGLKDSTLSFRSNDYDYHEQVDISGARMRHRYDVTNINGTEKMEIEDGDVIYQYVFEKDVPGLGGTGSGSQAANYSFPLSVKLMGKEYVLVGTGSSNDVRILSGTIGTADATKGVTYGDYTAYATLGSNNAWAKIVVQDKNANTVATEVLNDPDVSGTSSKDISSAGITVKVTDVKALQDGTVVGVDLVIGPLGTVEKTFDGTADTTSTGTASDRFSGTTDWGIRTANWGSTAGTISANARLEVVYRPTTTQYLKAGEKLAFPSEYAELGFEGFGTSSFSKITVKDSGTVSGFNNSADTQSFGNLRGLEISSDTASSIVGLGGNTYDKAYVLLNYTNTANSPVLIGFWDKAKSKIIVNGTPQTFATVNGVADASTELTTALLQANTAVKYLFNISYAGAGERQYNINVTVFSHNSNSTWFGTGSTKPIIDVTAGVVGSMNTNMTFQNYSASWTGSTSPSFRLGANNGNAEAADILVTGLGTSGSATTASQVGAATQDVLNDQGISILAASSNSASDQVVLKVPNKELTVKAFFGKRGAVTETESTYNKISPVTSAVAKLDKEVGAAEKAKNLVLVGGPCVNKLTAEALGKTFPACGAASGITANTALIQAVDGAFATGKVALVVAGWEADNTRLATSVLQNYDKHLKGVTASKVTVTGTVAAPVVTPSS